MPARRQAIPATRRDAFGQKIPSSRGTSSAPHPPDDGGNLGRKELPAGTPSDIIMLLNREIANVIALPDMKEPTRSRSSFFASAS
jgi:hypothetical protein